MREEEKVSIETIESVTTRANVINNTIILPQVVESMTHSCYC